MTESHRDLAGNYATGHALSFGAVADRYDRYRPSYARAALEWVTGDRPLRVADVGAGTGILSRQLAGLGHEVIAIEPDDQMLQRLIEVSAGVTALAGTAESIPLRDASVDLVVAGQAYHWFDPDRAHPEIARILKPGGTFAPMWNTALDTPWTIRLHEIIDGNRDPAEGRPAETFGEAFTPIEVARFPHEIWMTPHDLVAMATTRSPFLVASPADRKKLLDAIHQLLHDFGLADQTRFAMPHHTDVHRATRR